MNKTVLFDQTSVLLYTDKKGRFFYWAYVGQGIWEFFPVNPQDQDRMQQQNLITEEQSVYNPYDNCVVWKVIEFIGE